MSDHPYRYQAARLIADLTQDIDAISAIEGAMTYVAGKDSSPPDPSTLVELTPELVSEREYRELVYLLKEARIIDNNGADATELRAIFDTARVLAERGPFPTNNIVANTPLDDDDVGDSIGSLVVNLLDLIQQAESDLIILNPFFSEEGYDQIGAPISDATARNVDVTIITKSLTYGGSTQNERVMRELFQEDNTLTKNLTLYEYVLDDDPNEEYPPTIHAKLTVADRERAYLGTANMTHRGLVENLELGVIFQEDSVGNLLELVQDLLSSEYLHPVDYTSSGFERG